MVSDYKELLRQMREYHATTTMYHPWVPKATAAIESQAREIAELRADLDKARTAIRVQAAAVRTLDTTGRVLAAHDRAAAERARSESRPEALESERAMNAQLTEENDALRARAEAAERAIKDHNDGCVAACEARKRGDYGQDCSAWISRKRRCLDCARDSMIDYPAAIAAGWDDAKD